MAGHVNASWEIPPHSWLNISDCDAIAPWMAYYMVIESEQGAAGYWNGGTPVNVVLAFLNSLVPNNWTQPTNGDLLLWYLDLFSYFRADNLEAISKIYDFTMYECGAKVCPNLDFSGDADLSGIGMVISYYMVAIFVTLYYFALIPGVFEAYGHSFRSSTLVSKYRKFASGFEESISGFLDAMLLFSISMLVAAVTRYSALFLHPDETHSMFGLQDCVFLSTFSIFPALVLQSLSYDQCRRRIRLVLWDFVIASAVTVEVLYRVEYRGWLHTFTFTNGDSTSYPGSPGGTSGVEQLTQVAWFAVCQSERLRESLQTLLSVGHGVLVANLAAWLYQLAQVYFGAWWVPRLQSHEVLWRRWEACRLWLRLVNGALCLCIMWAFLGLFTAYRHDVMEKAGEADEDGEWTFGQVLSLTTWVPIGIELISVYIYGAQETVQRGLSKRFKVVDKNRRSQFLNDQLVYEKTPGTDMSPMGEAHLYEKAPGMDVIPVDEAHFYEEASSTDVTPIDEAHVSASDRYRYDS